MSHFTTIVLINPADVEMSDRKSVETAVKKLLAPYDEGLEVPEYDHPCHCVGRMAQQEVDAEADQIFGTMDDLRKRFADENPGEMDYDEREERLKAFIGPRIDWETEALSKHPGRTAPDPTCGFYTGERQDYWPATAQTGDRYEDGSGCAGTGTYKSTYNPKSKWDWYQIGGRWDGFITKNATDAPYHGSNVIPVKAMAPDVVPFALVTPDGEWHQRGRMGWWAMVSDEKPKGTWEEEVRALLAAHPDAVAVGLDLHI